MAIMTLMLTDDLQAKLNKLGSDEEGYKKVAKAAVKPLKEATESVLRSHIRTGQMVRAIKAKCSKGKDGKYYITAYPVGDRDKGTVKAKGGKRALRNNDVAAFLENGTSKQAATPWMDESARLASANALAAMDAELTKRIDELNL